MKRHVILFSIIIFVSLILWVSMPAQQLYKQTGTNMTMYTQKIDTLQLRIKRMEKELAELRKVIKINGSNVEIKSQGTLQLNGSNLSMNSQSKLNIKGVTLTMKSTTMALTSGSEMKLKGSIIKLN